MRRALILLTAVLASYGCATPERCSEQQFFKAFVDGKPNPNRYFPAVAELQLHKDVTLRVSICNRERADALCVEIYPTEDISFHFLEPRVTLSTFVTGSRVALPLEKITYRILCHGETLSEKEADCESSTVSPVIGNASTQRTRVRASKIGAKFYYLDEYEFSPDGTFNGAMVSTTLLMKFRRKYEAVTQSFQPSKGEELLVTVPSLRIGTQTLDVPQVAFKYVTETVCLPNRPLSLQ